MRSPRVWLALMIALIAGGATSRFVTSYLEPHLGSHEVAATDLKVGDCFNAPAGDFGITGLRVQQVSCDKPHNSQVYAEPDVTDSSFLGSGYLHSDANDTCQDSANESTISEILQADYNFVDFYPDNASAFTSQKTYICVLQFASQTSETWLQTDTTG